MVTVDNVKANTSEKFWSKVHFGESNDCWEWIAYKDKDGYGNFRIKDYRGRHTMIGSHRYMYKMVVDDFNDDLLCLHSCDNPPCVNPNHLWIGTNDDNIQDMIKKGRNVTYHLPPMVGSKHPKAKLDEEIVRRIKEKILSGVKQRAIAKEYDVYETVISKIKKGVLWRHVLI